MAQVLKATDFSSLQAAISAAKAFDTVVVPAGTRECAPFRLKSNLTLRLEAGARLVASRDINCYRDGEMLHRESTISRCFIGGFDLENVIIEGDGVFDCSGDAFWLDYDGKPSPADSLIKTGVYQPAPIRPTAMMFVNCRNLKLRGFSIVNSAAYTVWLIGCDTVRLENLTVRNHRRGPNTDGFDIDCSRDVTVIGCNLNCGDDCIAIKSDIAILGRDQPCERILVADCILSSPCCAVRLGYEGDGVIRDVIVVNTVIHDSNKGFDLISVLPEKRRFSICRGTQIENIVFQGAVMRNVRQALAVWSGTDNPSDAADYRGFIRRLIFSDLNIEATDSSFFGGAAVSELTLNNVNMRVRRDPASCRDATPVVMPNVWGHGFLPNLLTFHQVADPVLDHVRVTELTAESQEN